MSERPKCIHAVIGRNPDGYPWMDCLLSREEECDCCPQYEAEDDEERLLRRIEINRIKGMHP